VTQPVKGAQKEGFVGALKGAGRGLVGVVVKPTVGVVDLVARTTEGIANTASYFEQKNRARKRYPRYIGRNQMLSVRVSTISCTISHSALQLRGC